MSVNIVNDKMCRRRNEIFPQQISNKTGSKVLVQMKFLKYMLALMINCFCESIVLDFSVVTLSSVKHTICFIEL